MIGEGPAPEEILTAFIINERKVSFKSGYGKYISVDKNDLVIGRSDAVGLLEQWEPVFQVKFYILCISLFRILVFINVKNLYFTFSGWKTCSFSQ